MAQCYHDQLTREEEKQLKRKYEVLQSGSCWHCNKPLWMCPPDKVVNLTTQLDLSIPNEYTVPTRLHYNPITGERTGLVHVRCDYYLKELNKSLLNHSMEGK